MTHELFLSTNCAMTRTMAILGTKWKPILIYTIGKKTMRFGQLSAQVELISRKVLTEQLKELEDDGILVRQAFSEIPPRVEYHLSEKGLALLPILEEMCTWNRKFDTRAEVNCKLEKEGLLKKKKV